VTARSQHNQTGRLLVVRGPVSALVAGHSSLDRWPEDVAAEARSELCDLSGWRVLDRIRICSTPWDDDGQQPALSGGDISPAVRSVPRHGCASSGPAHRRSSRQRQFGTAPTTPGSVLPRAMTVCRHSAAWLSHRFDHGVRAIRIAAVDPDRLALTVGARDHTPSSGDDVSRSPLRDVSMLPPI
jgi:hypothetical protein